MLETTQHLRAPRKKQRHNAERGPGVGEFISEVVSSMADALLVVHAVPWRTA
jgi:hypothetical protein